VWELNCLRRALLLWACVAGIDTAAGADSAYIATLNGSFGILDFGTRTFTLLGASSAIYSGLGFDAMHNLWTVELSTGRILKVNPANGIGTAVGSGTGVSNWAMAGLTTGALYEVDRNSNLLSLNPATGAATLLGPIGLPAPSGSDAGGLTGTGGVLYYMFNDSSLADARSILYKIDPAACCTAQRVGTGTGIAVIGAAAFINGTLYGFDNGGRNVVKIDTTTGAATVVFAYPAAMSVAMAGDKVTGATDVAWNPGRLLVTAVGGQIIDASLDGSTGFNLAPYDYGSGSQTASAASAPSAALNGTIAFASARAGGGNRVFVMNGDGSNVRQITFPDATGTEDRWPAISPDGSKVAFVSARAVYNGYGIQKIFVVNIDGAGLRQVEALSLHNGATDQDQNVAWSPDSKKLAFRGVRWTNICNPAGGLGFQDAVGTVNLDGTGEKVLACNMAPHGENSLDWSPDGNLIAFGRSYDAGGATVVAIIDPSGNSKYGLTLAQLGSQTGGERGIHFSPDSTRLAYVNNAGSFAGISVINLNGSGRVDTLKFPSPGPFWWMAGPTIPAPFKMTLAPDPVQVWPGHNQQLVPSLLDASGNVIFHAVQIYTANGGCASIDAAGLVTLVNSSGTFKVSATNGGLNSNTVTINCLAQQPVPAVQNLSTASYAGGSFAAESIVSGFGTDLATTTLQVGTQPLPVSLGGTSITVKDSAGISRPAPLIGVSPGQVNYLIPVQTALGPATVTVTSGDGTVSSGTLMIVPVAPGLFSANFNGQGVAAAGALRASPPDFTPTSVAVAQCPAAGQCVSVPIDLGPETDQ
jgi:hypothetical protein